MRQQPVVGGTHAKDCNRYEAVIQAIPMAEPHKARTRPAIPAALFRSTDKQNLQFA